MKKIVCFGDSITAGYGFDHSPFTKGLEKELKGVEVINAGVPGHTTTDGLKRVKRDVFAYQPDVVTILFGSNDAAPHRRVMLNQFRENLLQITEVCKESEVLFITPPAVDESAQNKRTNQDIQHYANVVKEVAAITDKHCVDLFSNMINHPHYKQMVKGPDQDGLHFSLYGYDFLTSLVLKKLALL